MSYEEFKWSFLEEVRAQAGENITVRLHQVPKNNGCVLEGISITDSEKRLSPVMYIEPYYKKYTDGDQISFLASELLYSASEALNNVELPFAGRPALPKICKQVYVKAVNAPLNETELENMPHYRIHDLALVFYYEVDLGEEREASIRVTQNDIEYWNITSDELLQMAMDNTVRDKDYTFTPIVDLIRAAGESETEEIPLYVLTNKDKVFGASTLFYPDLLKKISLRLNDDLYVLPSSIHEIIILPSGEAPEEAYLKKIVREVNLNEVSAEEILSNNIYRYNRENGELMMA